MKMSYVYVTMRHTVIGDVPRYQAMSSARLSTPHTTWKLDAESLGVLQNVDEKHD